MKLICGRGFLGEGKYKSKENNIPTQHYKVWTLIFTRCYKTYLNKNNVTYENIEVCKEWYNFQNFAKWFEENYVEGFEIDKDILCSDCKIYSPETCCFVPHEINCLFHKSKEVKGFYKNGRSKKYRVIVNKKHIGYYNTVEEAFESYKIAKEVHIKSLANKHKEKLTNQVYNILINYKVL